MPSRTDGTPHCALWRGLGKTGTQTKEYGAASWIISNMLSHRYHYYDSLWLYDRQDLATTSNGALLFRLNGHRSHLLDRTCSIAPAQCLCANLLQGEGQGQNLVTISILGSSTCAGGTEPPTCSGGTEPPTTATCRLPG